MHTKSVSCGIAVFDLGGTWFRWGRYVPSRGLTDCSRLPAISYLTNPELSASQLQHALADFVAHRAREMLDGSQSDSRIASVAVGAPVNAHDQTVLGSGPLWGPTARPFQLQEHLRSSLPGVEWHVVNDVTALLAPYMEEDAPFRKTLMITISSGIGSRLYDHRARRIPHDATHGIQGEIGHLTLTFELDGKVISRRCECGAWNHLNAFSSGRGIAQILKDLPGSSEKYGLSLAQPIHQWKQMDDRSRLRTFVTRLEQCDDVARELLDALVTPVSRTLTTALSMDPDIDRIVITGGVATGLGRHYRDALDRTFRRDGLYQISQRDPHYLSRRMYWEDADDLGGLRGAGLLATLNTAT